MSVQLWQLSDFALGVLLDAAKLNLEQAKRRVEHLEGLADGLKMLTDDRFARGERVLASRSNNQLKQVNKLIANGRGAVEAQRALVADIEAEYLHRNPPRLSRYERDQTMRQRDGFWSNKARRIGGSE